MTGCAKISVLSLSALLTFCGCTDPSAKLPSYGKVPEFQMTDSEGRSFEGKALAGKIWIADFIYTSCPAECPLMSGQMHKLAKQLAAEDDVRLVSISVDPAHDEPAVLNEFARRYGAPTPRWVFLTGTPSTVHVLAYQTFHVGDVIGRIEHSTKFVLVDKHGDIRGYYSSLGQSDLSALLADVEILRRARS